MIYLQLFLTFFEIGAVSFGGGYGMIALVRQKVLMHGWLEEEQFLNLIAVSESTPGPIAVNMATYIGSTQGGILGSFVATLGAVLPSFLIILLIAALVKNFMNYRGVKYFLGGVRPCVVGLILATACTMLLRILLGIETVNGGISVDPINIALFAVLIVTAVVYQAVKKKAPSPIAMILFAGGLGIAVGYLTECF